MKFTINALVTIAAPAVLFFLPCAVGAQIVKGDFHETLGLPDYLPDNGPMVLQRLGVTLPSAAPQLTVANQIANPSGYNGVLNVSFNAVTNILSLSGDSNVDYQDITVNINDLFFSTGQSVIGITPLVLNSGVTPETAAPTVSTFFTSNSFGVSYTETIPNNGDLFFINTPPAADTFQVELSPRDVPEPGSFALLLGIGAMAFRLRRRR